MKLVFTVSKDSKDRSMATTVRKVLSKVFDDEVLEKDCNGTSIRKMWDTYFPDQSNEIPNEARAFHAIQSSHTKETAAENYIVPNETGSDFYRKTLESTTSGSPSAVIKSPAAAKSSYVPKSPATTKPSSGTKCPAVTKFHLKPSPRSNQKQKAETYLNSYSKKKTSLFRRI